VHIVIAPSPENLPDPVASTVPPTLNDPDTVPDKVGLVMVLFVSVCVSVVPTTDPVAP
jgi:hypothetical protein